MALNKISGKQIQSAFAGNGLGIDTNGNATVLVRNGIQISDDYIELKLKNNSLTQDADGIALNPTGTASSILPPVQLYTDLASTYGSVAKTGDLCIVITEKTLYMFISPNLWISPAAYPKGFTSGCRLSYNNASTIDVGSGVLEIRGKFVQRISPLTVTWSDAEQGIIEAPSAWYYVYAIVSPTDPTTFNAFISTTVPNKDQYGNTISPDSYKSKYHPTLDARFIGSFRNDTSSNIVNFSINGNVVTYIGGGIQYVLSSGNARTKTGVNVRSRTPDTSNSINLYYEMGAGTNIRYVGDSVGWLLKVASACAGVLPSFPVTSDSVYYQCSGTNVVSLAVHGYIEDI